MERPLPELGGAEHRFAELDGLRVHYAEAGGGDPVLLLPGWPQHHAMWAPVIAGLADRFRVIAPDLRGFGWTDAPGAGYDGETFARDQVELLDALGIERAFVIGHDWGGWTALLLGIHHSDRVRRIIALDTAHPWAGPRPELLLEAWRSWYAACLALPGLGPLLLRRSGFTEGILRRGNHRDPFTAEERRAYADSFRPPGRARAISALYRYYFAAFARALRGGWRHTRLGVPTLLLIGAGDALVTPKLVSRPEEYQRHADAFTVEVVPDCGHFVPNERPELVIERARGFFAGR